MKKRIYLKKAKRESNKKIKKKNLKFIFLVPLFIALLFTIYFVENKLSISLKKYAKIETEKFLTTIINSLFQNNVLNQVNGNDIIQIYKNDQGEILYADFDNEKVNHILNDSVTLVQNSLISIENGKIDNLSLPDSIYSTYNKLDKGIIIEIPTGNLVNNSLFSNIGPKIPIKIQLLGAVKGNIKTNIEEYGINNSMVSIKVVIDVTEQIVLPISSDKIHTAIEIPIATKLIQGKIPTYYQNGLSTNSSIFSLPIK